MAAPDLLLAFLERAAAAQQRSHDESSPEQLRLLARELGLNDADLAAADAEAERRRVRGEGFLQHERWADAIQDLSEAAVLRPFDVEVLHALARAHLGEFRRSRGVEHRRRAERVARLCLERDPRHQPSFALLGEIDRAAALRSSWPWIALAGCTAALAAALLSRPAPPTPGHEHHASPTPAEAPAPQPVASAEPPAPPAVASVPVPAPQPAATGGDVRVSFPAAASAKLELDVRELRLAVYPSSAYLNLHGLVRNAGHDELIQLTFRLVLRDGSGAAVTERTHMAVSPFSAPARPGDTVPLSAVIPATAQTTSIDILVDKIDRKPAAGPYAPNTPVEVGWAVERAAARVLKVEQRAAWFTGAGDNRFASADLEISHGGTQPLEEVRFQWQLVNAKGGVLQVTEHHAAGMLSGPLWPGERRVVHVVARAPVSAVGGRLLFLDAHR